MNSFGSVSIGARTLAAIAGLLFALPVAAMPAAVTSILQVDVAVTMPDEDGKGNAFAAPITGGNATVRGVVRNQNDGDTVRVDLLFEYNEDDPVALDEILDRIVIRTEDGLVFSKVALNPFVAPLNPNRTTLSYRVTLYRPHPDGGGPYTVRIRVFGNYE